MRKFNQWCCKGSTVSVVPRGLKKLRNDKIVMKCVRCFDVYQTALYKHTILLLVYNANVSSPIAFMLKDKNVSELGNSEASDQYLSVYQHFVGRSRDIL